MPTGSCQGRKKRETWGGGIGMAEKDSLTEESKWLIELLRLLWVTLLAIGGSVAGLILGERGPLRDAFTVLGFIAMVILVAVMNKIRKRAEVIIKSLKEG
jgi:hypothetical protein